MNILPVVTLLLAGLVSGKSQGIFLGVEMRILYVNYLVANFACLHFSAGQFACSGFINTFFLLLETALEMGFTNVMREI